MCKLPGKVRGRAVLFALAEPLVAYAAYLVIRGFAVVVPLRNK